MIENEDIIQFELPDFSEITENGQRMLLEKTVKHKGIWRIHKNDPDDVFPSDPHADRIDAPEKLDLYNGKVYDKTTKEYLYTLPKKAMKYIYNQIMSCKEDMIKNKLISNSTLITYL